MSNMKRSFCLVLCLAVALCLLSGCGLGVGSPVSTPAPREVIEASPAIESAPSPSPEPTPEPVDYTALYKEALSRLEAEENLLVRYDTRLELQIPDPSAPEAQPVVYVETESGTIQYQGLGTKDLIAVVDENISMDGTFKAAVKKVYSDGLVTMNLKGTLFCSPVSASDFLASQLPSRLLDPENYAKLEAEEDRDLITLRFAEAVVAETWAMPGTAQLLGASGSAALAPEGRITSANYELSYRFGGVTVNAAVTVGYEQPEDPDLSGQVPENLKPYETLDSIDAPLYLRRASLLFDKATAVESTVNFTGYSEAGNFAVQGVETDRFLSSEGSFRMGLEQLITSVDFVSAETFTMSHEAKYADGSLTESFNDEELEVSPQNAVVMERNIRDRLDRYFPSYEMLVDAEMHSVGDYLLLNFTGNEEMSAQYKYIVSSELFTDPNVLDDNATAYVNKTMDGFLALEKVTGLPTALNLSYEGLHTLDGDSYSLQMVVNISLSMNTLNPVNALYEEPPLGPEPAEKPSPLLYEVTDEAGHRMYLFGTVHVGDSSTAYLPQEVYDALNTADALAVEYDIENSDAEDEETSAVIVQTLESFYYTDGTTIQNPIDSDLYRAAVDIMKVSGSYISTAEMMKPFLWSSAIDQFYLSQGRDLSSENGVDRQLLRLAKEAGKEILDVESQAFQMGLLSGYSDAVQEMMLASSLSNSPSEYNQGTRELFDAWCAGDESTLRELVKSMDQEDRDKLDEEDLAIYEEYHQRMEVDRNRNMLEVAKSYLNEGRTVFFAVGTAHLLGEEGLVNALRDAGYTITLLSGQA